MDNIREMILILSDWVENFLCILSLCTIWEDRILFKLLELLLMKLPSIGLLWIEKILLIVLLWYSLLCCNILLILRNLSLWIWINLLCLIRLFCFWILISRLLLGRVTILLSGLNRGTICRMSMLLWEILLRLLWNWLN